MSMKSSNLLLDPIPLDVFFLNLALIWLGQLFALLLWTWSLRRRELAAKAAETTSSNELATMISSNAAQEKVFDLVNRIRATGVQLEVITAGHGLILEIRRSSKLEIEQTGLLELLRSVSGVSNICLGGGKSKGAGRRYPITVSIHFTNDTDAHHAFVNLVEAIG